MGGLKYLPEPVMSLLVLYYPLVRTAYRMGRCGAYAVQLWYHLRTIRAG